jgi:SAM-dependent methyltransferase
MGGTADRWNHNINYHATLLRAVPLHAQSALDIGCGEGMFTRELAPVIPTVVGIDSDQLSIDQAREQAGVQPIEYLLGDFLEYPFENESFDFIASVATLHHMNAAAALTRMGTLLRPGGALAILGLARSSSLRDLPYEVAGLIAHRAHSLTRVHWVLAVLTDLVQAGRPMTSQPPEVRRSAWVRAHAIRRTSSVSDAPLPVHDGLAAS